MTFRLVDEVPVDPARARVYAEGWQSWSPATWYAPGVSGIRPATGWQQAMRFRPGKPLPERGLQGEGLVVVDPGGGAPARWYGAADAVTAVPTLRAVLDAGRVVVEADGDVTSGEGPSGEAAVAVFADGFAARAGVAALRPAPRVWCSWYRYFEDVTVADVQENLAALGEGDLAVDVVQIDDGWSRGLGEGLAPRDGFTSLPRLVDEIRATGRTAGLWLAPFLVGADSTLAHEHPDWLVGDAGHNWGQDLVGLDLTHPGVREHLAEELARLRGLGIGYLKLDFLYGGAIPGRRHDDVSEVEAYRRGLALVRDAVGPDVYLLGCGAPILPSVGLVDAMRVSPDTFHEGGEDGSSGLRGLMPLTARAWQHGRWWVNDADCLVTRPSYRLREQCAEALTRFGGLRSFSDRIAELDAWALHTTRRLLSEAPPPLPFGDDVVEQGARVAAGLVADQAGVGAP